MTITRLFQLKSCRQLYFIILLLIFCCTCEAQLWLPHVFSNNMVLQQQKPIPIWGKAKAGAKVSIHFRGKQFSTHANVGGKWSLQLPVFSYGGPYELTVKSEGKKIRFNNILIGEVWVCSGQSNMEMPLEGWPNDGGSFRLPVNHAQHEIAKANFPNIRLLQVQPTFSSRMTEDITVVGDQWRECSPPTVKTFSSTAYFFAREVYTQTGIPIGLIQSAVGGSTAELWTSLLMLKTIPSYKQRAIKVEKDTSARDYGIGSLFNGMIAPLTPYGIRGVLWYQGEFNAFGAYDYKELFPKLIRDWRQRWQQGDFPFFYVQLPVTYERDSIDIKSAWAEMREAQFETLTEANTAMAVTIDLKDPDLHPSNKQDFGLRLAYIALGKLYGKPIPYSGPLYKESRIESDSVRIFFSNPEVGLRSRNGFELEGFYIAGTDSVFYRAKATIDGHTIVAKSKNVSKPISVRYQWGNNPDGNLFSDWLLPASPFRTDNWEMITRKNK